MYISYEEFKASYTFLAELCDKPPPGDKKMRWFHEQVRYVDHSELKRAMSVFGVRMKWPSAKELLQECGAHVPPTREEQSRMNDRTEEKVEQKDDPEHHTKSYGIWCFLSEIETNNEQDGKHKLDIKCKELAALGWNIYNQEDFSTKKKIRVGNQDHEKRVFCRKTWAFRFEGEKDAARDARYLKFFQGQVHAAK